jgi:hypothetical protein
MVDKLTKYQNPVLEILDEQIEDLEEKLKKVQPLIDELHRLQATRRVLLSERGVTSGGGNHRVQLTMEQLVHFMREHGAIDEDEAVTVAYVAEGLSVPPASVRSHFSRGKDTRYGQNNAGEWYLLGADAPEEEDEE